MVQITCINSFVSWDHIWKNTTSKQAYYRCRYKSSCHSCRLKNSLTVDDEGEVAVIERRLWNRNASFVEAIVDPLASAGGHVQDSLHRILWAVAKQVPVHHPLTVFQSVTGPHHSGAVAGQNRLRACGEGDVLGLHQHTRPAAAALTPCWHKEINTQIQTTNVVMTEGEVY